jgi:tetratricopeptide (TPR) repeat protein
MARVVAILVLNCTLLLGQQPTADDLALTREAVRLMQARRPADALRLVREALDKNPRNSNTWFRKYLIHRELEQYQDAIAALREAVLLQPENTLLVATLGQMYFLTDDLAQGKDLTRRAVEKAGSDLQLLIGMAVAPVVAGRPDYTELVSEFIYRLHPENAPNASNLAYALAEQNKDLDRALSLAQFAYETLPRLPSIIDVLGWVHLVRGETKSAVPLLIRALSMQPAQKNFQRHTLRALDSLQDPSPLQLELRDWLRGDDDPDKDKRVSQLSAELAR